MLRLLLILSSLIIAKEAIALDYSLSGFVGYNHVQSTVHSNLDDNPYDFGLLFSSDLNENISASVHLKYTGGEHVEDILAFGFLSYHTDLFKLPIELQVGKFRYDNGLHGGDLTNPRVRPGIIVPQSIYWDSLRYMRDGYGFRMMTQYKNFELSTSIGKSVSHNREQEIFAWLNVPANYLSFNNELDMEGKFGNVFNSFLKYTDDNNVVKLGYGFVDFNEYIAAEYISFGYQFSFTDWTIEAETLLINPTTKHTNTSFFNFSSDLNKGYSLSLSYTVNDNVKIYSNYNTYERKGELVQFDHNWNRYNDTSIGVMYNITDSILFRTELHRSEGSSVLTDKYPQSDNNYDNYYMGAFGITYFF